MMTFREISPSDTPKRLPLPPRRVWPRFDSIAGPNFQYFLHVIIFSLIPLVIFAWLAFHFVWAAFGTNIEGQFTYYLILSENGGPPRDQMQVQYTLDHQPQTLPVSVGGQYLRQLGMPAKTAVEPGKPLLTAAVSVRVLKVGSYHYAEAVFPWTWVWKQMIFPLVLLLLTSGGMWVLHRELFLAMIRTPRLVKRGLVIAGRLLGTHETGWWESSGDYGWTYIRRCYMDYAFNGPDGREHRGCQLVLGYIDPALLAEGQAVTVMYDPDDIDNHLVYEACAYQTREHKERVSANDPTRHE